MGGRTAVSVVMPSSLARGRRPHPSRCLADRESGWPDSRLESLISTSMLLARRLRCPVPFIFREASRTVGRPVVC